MENYKTFRFTELPHMKSVEGKLLYKSSMWKELESIFFDQEIGSDSYWTWADCDARKCVIALDHAQLISCNLLLKVRAACGDKCCTYCC